MRVRAVVNRCDAVRAVVNRCDAVARVVNRCGRRGQQVRKAWSTGAEGVVNRCGKHGIQPVFTPIFSSCPISPDFPDLPKRGERERAGERASAGATRSPASSSTNPCSERRTQRLTEGRLSDPPSRSGHPCQAPLLVWTIGPLSRAAMMESGQAGCAGSPRSECPSGRSSSPSSSAVRCCWRHS